MQLEKKKDLEYIAPRSEHDFRYAAIVDETGREMVITDEMIERLYQRLCAEKTIRSTLQPV